MASTQEPWAPTPVPTLTTRNSPHFQPALVGLATDDYVLGSGHSGYPSGLTAGPSLSGPTDMTQNQELSNLDSAQPSYDPNYLSPHSTAVRPTWQPGQPFMTPPPGPVPSHRVGVDPVSREQLGSAEIPSLEDQDRADKLESEIAKVEDWLQTSSLGDYDTPTYPTTHVRGGSRRVPSLQSLRPGQTSSRTPPRGTNVPTITPTILGAGVASKDDKNVEADEDFLFGESTTPPASLENEGLFTGTVTAAPLPTSTYQNHEPWTDFPGDVDSARIKEQPPSSNAAISVFMKKAKDLETASLTATLGSRRRSEADLNSLFSKEGAAPAAKSPNIIKKFLVNRAGSNSKKRKENQEEQAVSSEVPGPSRKLSQGNRSLKLVRSRSPKPESGAENQPSQSPNRRSRGMSVIQRIRSRSDVSSSDAPFNIAEQWRRTAGGPPVPNLRTQQPESLSYDQAQVPVPAEQLTSPDDGDGDDDGLPDAAAPVSLRVDEAPLAATKEGFKDHARKLNPAIEPYMLDRLTQEQDRRFRRLVEYHNKHNQAVQHNTCPSGVLCGTLGKGPNYLVSPSSRGAEISTPIFYVSHTEPTEGLPESGEKASFPEGIPLPPVERLPAEFECPLCFQVKRVLKPSDWTKHVNEDIQPFTCTFPNCPEAKSFKRKADWVRHESERHRHLEAWQCDWEGCTHRCYRRDNFVQHLVREHRLPEPQVRITKNLIRGGSHSYDSGEIVAQQVERCRQESTRRPMDEPCRFCKNKCESWKKLSVHLALHMQQISIPILKLLDIAIPTSGVQSRGPRTPSGTSPGSRTTGPSQPGSSMLSYPQSNVSSTGFSESTRPPVEVMVTAPMHTPTRPRAGTIDWMMYGGGREESTFPVVRPPGTPGFLPSNPLGISAEPSNTPSRATHLASGSQTSQYGQVPLTPQSPEVFTRTGSYSSGSQLDNSTIETTTATYPPPSFRPNQRAGYPSLPQLEVSHVLPDSTLQTSPVEVGESEVDVDLVGLTSEPQQSHNDFYHWPTEMNYPVSQSFNPELSHQSSSFPLGSNNTGEWYDSGETGGQHSATYPPQYFSTYGQRRQS